MFFDQNMPLRHFQSESIYISHITYVHEENLLIFLGYEKGGFSESLSLRSFFGDVIIPRKVRSTRKKT